MVLADCSDLFFGCALRTGFIWLNRAIVSALQVERCSSSRSREVLRIGTRLQVHPCKARLAPSLALHGPAPQYLPTPTLAAVLRFTIGLEHLPFTLLTTTLRSKVLGSGLSHNKSSQSGSEPPHSVRSVVWVAARRTVDRQGWRAIEPYMDVLVGVSCARLPTAPSELRSTTLPSTTPWSTTLAFC